MPNLVDLRSRILFALARRDLRHVSSISATIPGPKGPGLPGPPLPDAPHLPPEEPRRFPIHPEIPRQPIHQPVHEPITEPDREPPAEGS